MNITEILDELKYFTKVLNMNTDMGTKPLVEAATMLRQQQAEIERLIMLCDCMTTESNRKGNEIEELKALLVKEQDESFDRTASHMAGEYVSWTSCVACGQRVTGDSIHTCSPQLKQLTDEEIMEVYMSIWNQPMEMEDIEKADITFARAILRKASEK